MKTVLGSQYAQKAAEDYGRVLTEYMLALPTMGSKNFKSGGAPTYIEASNVVLRDYHPKDYEAVCALLVDPEIMRLVFSGPMTLEAADRFIRDDFGHNDPAGPRLGILCRKQDELMVGFAGYLPCYRFGSDDIEFGFVVAKEHQRKRYASEIGQAMIDHVFNEGDRTRVLARCHPNNHVSRRILQDRLNMGILWEPSPSQEISPNTRIWFEFCREWYRHAGAISAGNR